MFGRSTAGFDRLLEKSTSQLLLEPDWSSIMMICDAIRQGDTNPKYAVAAIKKKFYHQNPHAALYALQVMESCVKNCGVLIHDEIATKGFMEELRELVKQTTEDSIKNKVLELIQTWGTAFRNSKKYRIVTDTLHLMQAEGWKFPPVREAEAMYEADIAPNWEEGEVCHRCRVQFSTFTRQHHCRACGQVFCGKCSSKSCVLPKFGIEREVRVCDSCFDQYGPKEEDSPIHQAKPQGPMGMKEPDLPAEYLASPLSKQPQEPGKPNGGTGGKSEAEMKEEEELQLVLALSKSEAEEKEKMKKKATSDILAGLENNKVKASNGTANHQTSPEEADPELAKYLNRDYWESKKDGGQQQQQQQQQQQLDAGIPEGVAQAKAAIAASGLPDYRTVESLQGAGAGERRVDDEELEEFTSNLRTQLEIFVNRMKSNSSRGRPIANDSSVQTLFMNMMTMHSKLVKYIQEQEDARVNYEGLQDKLTQVKDNRAALDALREEERERRRREAEEAERQRQIQMAKKLDLMRKKKAEYLEYQRQVALQRMADQEREMAAMAEASKQTYINQQQGIHNMYLPYGGFMPGQQPFNPGMQPGMPGMHPGMLGAAGGMPPHQPAFPVADGGPRHEMQQQPGSNTNPYNMQAMAGALPGGNTDTNNQQPQMTQQLPSGQQMPPLGHPQMPGHGMPGQHTPHGVGQQPPHGVGQQPPHGGVGQQPPHGGVGQPMPLPGQQGMPQPGPPQQLPMTTQQPPIMSSTPAMPPTMLQPGQVVNQPGPAVPQQGVAPQGQPQGAGQAGGVPPPPAQEPTLISFD